MLAGCCLVPFDLRSLGLGSPSLHACCQGAGRCLVPCGLASLGLGSPSQLLGALDDVTGLCRLLFVLVRSCSFSFALAAWIVSRTLAVAYLGLGLSCWGGVGLRFGLPGLFVRSRSRLPPGSFPARSPWLSGSWPGLLR